MWGSRRAPACDLERRSEDLGAYKLSHGGLLVCGFCDRREEGEIRRGEVVLVWLVCSVAQQVCVQMRPRQGCVRLLGLVGVASADL